jgi:hypothetical protein
MISLSRGTADAALDPPCRQERTKRFDPFSTHLRPPEIQGTERREPFEASQTGVGHGCIGEPETCQIGHARQVRQPGVGDPGAAEVELIEPGHRGEMGETYVGNLGAAEIQHLQVGPAGDGRQIFVGNC